MIEIQKINSIYCVIVDWFDEDGTIMYSHRDKKKAEEYIEIAKKHYEEANQVSEKLYSNFRRKNQ